jgi:hypothetical protein
MTGQDMIRDDIIDKARGFLIQQVKIIIRTIPSTKYPRGRKFEGYVMDVSDRQILLHDTYVDEEITIYISEIASPSDIYLKEEKENGR